MDLVEDGYTLNNLGKINIILGKNGCGKSTLLKDVENRLASAENTRVKYISPERGGQLAYDGNVEHQLTHDSNYLSNDRRKNQPVRFKQQSMSQYRQLELLSLREIEQNAALRANYDYTFNTIVEQINSLLENIEIIRTEKNFEIVKKNTTDIISPENISSGESELISLAIECLSFEKQCSQGDRNILFLDEPDVHIHPDLQAKFAKFLMTIADNDKYIILTATHSTALLSAFANWEHAHFDFMESGQTEFAFKSIDSMYKKIIPIFGAHPLSNLFNESPILLVEGEDDVRIWQKAVRSSAGALKLYPFSIGGVNEMSTYETAVKGIIDAVYDEAKAYSLRDRDDGEEEIADDLPIIRFKFSCRNAESLLLTDEVLETLGTTWDNLQVQIETWIENFDGHPNHAKMVEFKDATYDRKNFDIKELRNLLVGLTGSSKPWEIAVGGTIAKLKTEAIPIDTSENKLSNYLGEKLVANIIQG